MPADLDEAYRVRGRIRGIEIARGRGEVAGYKIGLTTPIMQKLCGVDEPCYGAIFASEVHHRRAEIAGAQLLPARDRDRDRGAARRGSAAGRRARPGRGGGRELHGGDRGARRSAARLQAAQRRRDGRRQCVECRGRCSAAGDGLAPPRLVAATARLTINGREIGHGKGGDVMGNPLNALAWLANKLAAAGTPLQARHDRDDRQHGADPVPDRRRPRRRRGRGARHAPSCRDLSRCPISIPAWSARCCGPCRRRRRIG